MPHDVECTHCHVLMTTWSAAGSPVRYWQCPFCSRTHSSLYSEVFRAGAGARRVDSAPPPGPAGPPQASADEIAWSRLKLRAARWFARLEQEQLPGAARQPSAVVPARRLATNAARRAR